MRAFFADGTTADADLLVGADGAKYRVRGQLLPHARRLDTGVTAIAGKHRLPDDAVPDALLAGSMTAPPPGPGGMSPRCGGGDRARVAAAPAEAPPGFLFDTTADYVFWAYADATSAFPALDGLAGGGAHPRSSVRRRSARGRPACGGSWRARRRRRSTVLRVRSAEPVPPWPTGPVTLLGDAIHNMTPMAGIGANTALRDADLLRRNLIAVRDGRLSSTEAVDGYEREMLEYGFAAIAQSLRNARFAASGNPVARRLARGALRIVDAVPPIRRRMMGS